MSKPPKGMKDGKSKGIIKKENPKENLGSFKCYGSDDAQKNPEVPKVEGFCKSQNDMSARLEEIHNSINGEKPESYLTNNSSETQSESVNTYVKKDLNFLRSRTPGKDFVDSNTIDIINNNVNYFFDDKEISEISAQAEMDRGRFLNEQDSFRFTGVGSDFGDRGDTPYEMGQGLPCRQEAMEEFMRDSVGRQSIKVRSPHARKDEKKVSMPILKFKEGMFGKKQTPVMTVVGKTIPTKTKSPCPKAGPIKVPTKTKSPGPKAGPIKVPPKTKSPGPKAGNISNRILEGLVQLSDRVMGGGL